jgi:hypothetical protein
LQEARHATQPDKSRVTIKFLTCVREYQPGYPLLRFTLQLLLGAFPQPQANGKVTPVYGPRCKLKALFLRREDGANAVEAHLRVGERYSFQQRLDGGYHTWKHKRLDVKGDDGTTLSTRDAFLQVIADCLVA